MKKIFRITLLFLLFGKESGISAQSTLDTFYVSADTYVADGTGASTNYGSNTLMKVYYDYRSLSTSIHRTFLDFDLSSIPENAIMVSATLKLESNYVNNSLSHPFYIERVAASWVEGSITWNNQPSVNTSDQISVPHSDVSGSGTHSFDVTSHVQYMVNYPDLNYGWRIRLQTESGSQDNGVYYYSSDYSSGSKQPVLEVSYVLPVEITGYVSHCTNGNNDGSISVSIGEGVGSYAQYDWLKFDAGEVSVIESGTNFANIDVDGLYPGLYLLHVEDDSGYTNYRYFMVGEEGEETTVEFHADNADTADMFNEDALIATSYSGILNFEPYDKYYISDDGSTHTAGVGKFKVDFDYLLNFQQADLRLYSYSPSYHTNPSGSSNEGKISRITEDWTENIVVWNYRPSTTTTDQITVPQTTTGNSYRNDTIDLLDFVEYWQENPDENYGFDFSLSSYSNPGYTRLIYGGSGQSTAANRPKFIVSFAVKPSIVTNWVDSTEMGNITVNAPQAPLPYTYFISYDSIPNMDTLWYSIKDTIPIDSADFYQGDINSQTYTFSDLTAEHYHISVFDNNGDRILYKEVDLSPTFEVFENVQVEELEDTLQVDDGYTWGSATLLCELDKKDNGGIEFEILKLGGMAFGWNVSSQTKCTKWEDFEYAFKLDSNGYFDIVKSGTAVFSDTLEVNDKIRIIKENNTLYFYLNNTYLHEELIPYDKVSNYKAEVLFTEKKGMISFPLAVNIALKPKPISYSTKNPECEMDEGSIGITSNGISYWNITNISYDIIETTGDTSVLGTPGTTLPFSTSLSVGTYQLQYSWTMNGTVYTVYEPFRIGYPIYWDLQNNYFTYLNGSVNSVVTNTINQQAHATSFNTLPKNTDGWVEYKCDLKKVYVKPGDPIPVPSPVTVSMLDANNDAIIDVDTYLMGNNILNKIIIVTEGGSSTVLGSQNIYDDGPILIDLVSGDFKVYYDNGTTPIATVSEGTSSNHKVEGLAVNGVIYDAYASFCYGLTTSELCGELDYELDGNYYVTNNGKFCFVWDEEYNDTTITFNLYNLNNDVVATQADFSIPNLIYGENRIVLDLSAVDCLCEGFFVLEVINEKGEKKYLRYYSDLSGNCFLPLDCIVYPEQGPK